MGELAPDEAYLMAEMDPEHERGLDCFDRWIVDGLLSLGFTIRESLGDPPAHDLDTVFEMGRLFPLDRRIADQIIRRYSVNGVVVKIDEKKMIRERPA